MHDTNVCCFLPTWVLTSVKWLSKITHEKTHFFFFCLRSMCIVYIFLLLFRCSYVQCSVFTVQVKVNVCLVHVSVLLFFLFFFFYWHFLSFFFLYLFLVSCVQLKQFFLFSFVSVLHSLSPIYVYKYFLCCRWFKSCNFCWFFFGFNSIKK